MSEHLIVRLNSQKDELIQWLVWSQITQTVIVSGEINEDEVETLLQYHQPENHPVRPIIVLLPSHKILISSIDVPKGAMRQIDTMLPFLMEDALGQDIESIHFSLLSKAQESAVVASVDKAYFASCIESFKSANMTIQRILPDCLALPYTDDRASAMKFNQHWLFRQGELKGASVDEEWLELFLSSGWLSASGDKVISLDDIGEEDETLTLDEALDDETQIQFKATASAQKREDEVVIQTESELDELTQESSMIEIDCYSKLPPNYANLLGRWSQAKEANLPLATLAPFSVSSKVNLLTGAFKPQAEWRAYWQIWRKAAIAIGVFFIFSLTQKYLLMNQLEAQINSYQTENERIFKMTLPGKKKIPTVSYLKRQMQSEVDSLTGGNGAGGASLLTWVSSLPPALAKTKDLKLLGLRFDGQKKEMTLEVEGNDFEPFETLRAQLAQSYQVEQGQLSKNESKVYGSYVMREKP